VVGDQGLDMAREVGGGSEKCLEKASSINSDKKFSISLSSVSNISAFKF
jgi:hypothetical protein